MGHGRKVQRAFVEDGVPKMESGDCWARVVEFRDKGIIAVNVAIDNDTIEASLAFLPARFRGTLFLRRGGFVQVRPLAPTECSVSREDAKVQWAIENLLSTEHIKELRKEKRWPSAFEPRPALPEEEENTEETEGSEEASD